MNKNELIEKVISDSGLPTPPVEDILSRIEMRAGNSNIDTVKMIIQKYNEYSLSYRIINISTEEKFIKKQDRKVNLDDFVFRAMFRNSFPIPRTKLVDALFGENDFFEMYNKYLKVKKKIELKRKKYEPIYTKLLKEAQQRKENGNNPIKEGTDKT